ncbi:MAG: hypothetical protein HY903_04230 [Deltaproteobacteria bacterium]|nr:hypothetical protein [Deltaproteobacteria bacterium]
MPQQAPPVAAQEPPTGAPEDAPPTTTPQNRLMYETRDVARLNPKGLQIELIGSYRRRLSDSDALLWRDTFVDVGAILGVTPAFGKAGAVVRVRPLAVLELGAQYEWLTYFGTFGFFQSFPSAAGDFSDPELARRSKDDKLSYKTSGTQLTLSGLLQAKLGKIAVRNNARFYRFDMKTHSDDPAFYDMIIDLLVPNHGWAMTNDLDVVYMSDTGLTAGIRYTASRALYRGAADRKTDAGAATHRAGPLAAYTFFDEPGGRFNKPSVFVASAWWLAHPYRAGKVSSQAFPCLVLGFAAQGDLL